MIILDDDRISKFFLESTENRSRFFSPFRFCTNAMVLPSGVLYIRCSKNDYFCCKQRKRVVIFSIYRDAFHSAAVFHCTIMCLYNTITLSHYAVARCNHLIGPPKKSSNPKTVSARIRLPPGQ